MIETATRNDCTTQLHATSEKHWLKKVPLPSSAAKRQISTAEGNIPQCHCVCDSEQPGNSTGKTLFLADSTVSKVTTWYRIQPLGTPREF